MRSGDFRGTAITVRDPLTGQPFPNNVIPANRLSPAAQKIMDYFYPLPNQGLLASGYGVFQEFVPITRKRQRADLRFDHEASPNDSIFLRASYQNRDPSNIAFEGGNAFTNLPILDFKLDTAAVIAGWTKILSPTVVNEFRVGYNYDRSTRQSTFSTPEITAQLGLENGASYANALGFPTMSFAGANRPTNIADAARNVNRTLRQNAFSVSNNISWIMGSHSLKAGALWTRNSAVDGFGLGINNRGSYQFSGAATGNAFSDFLLGTTRRVQESTSGRGPLDGTSNDFAVFVQDDWKVSSQLTVFLGLRYELAGAWNEKDNLLANFIPEDGGYHVVASQEVANRLPPGLIEKGRIRLASDVGMPDSLVNPDKNNFSPRVGFGTGSSRVPWPRASDCRP
jgi:hypothetical protein